MPLYRQLARGYEMVYLPANGHLYPTHRLADEWNLRHQTQTALPAILHAASTLKTQPIWQGSPNHKVQSIKALPGDHDVYCLTVPEAGNFALDAGVFTSNCGIIVNVTPFEPAWEGFVTLEISNTTPLPAKIYANEGIAQVLFFEGEEPEISYADRQGKYQGQVGITLPRMKS
jgi:hypothetical protein